MAADHVRVRVRVHEEFVDQLLLVDIVSAAGSVADIAHSGSLVHIERFPVAVERELELAFVGRQHFGVLAVADIAAVDIAHYLAADTEGFQGGRIASTKKMISFDSMNFHCGGLRNAH